MTKTHELKITPEFLQLLRKGVKHSKLERMTAISR